MPVAGALPVAGAIAGAAGSIIGGNRQANAARDAANAQLQGSREAIGANMAFYNQGRQDNYGNMVTGGSALRQLAGLYGLDYYTGQPSWDGVSTSGGTGRNPMTFSAGGSGQGGAGGQGGMPGTIATGTGMTDYSPFYMSPDYQVRQQEGQQAIDRRNAAMGGYRGGGGDLDTMRFNANLGAQGFGDYRNTLLNLAGFGSQANSQVGAAGQQFGSNIANASQSAGNARASGYLNAGNARNDAWNGVGSAFGQLWGNHG
jgi:hypothetical protein